MINLYGLEIRKLEKYFCHTTLQCHILILFNKIAYKAQNKISFLHNSKKGFLLLKNIVLYKKGDKNERVYYAI